MARAYEISEICGDWALRIEGPGEGRIFLYFNSRNNAEMVKDILKWEDAHPNEAVPYKATITQPNEPLTLEQLRKMDGEPVWYNDEKVWALLQVWDDDNIDMVFPMPRGCFRVKSVIGIKIYRHPPEGEEDT